MVLTETKMKYSKERMLLSTATLQACRNARSLLQTCKVAVDKLIEYFHVADIAVALSIHEFKILENTNPQDLSSVNVKSHVVVEAIASACESYLQLNIEDILREEYQWGESTTNKIIDLYASGLTRCEIDLAEMFADKDYLLVPIVLTEAAEPLWGFLMVYRCKALDNQSLIEQWNQDDVLLLHQVAMQIEIVLQQENTQAILQQRLADAEQANNALTHWNEQYRSLVEDVPSISYISPISNTPEFAYISPQIKELLDVPESEWTAGFFNNWVKYVHPDDRDRIQQEVRHTIETGTPFSCEYRFVTREGKMIWVQDNAYLGLAYDGKTQVLRGSAFNISDRKESELRFKGIFNNTFQFTGLMSTDGVFLEANQTALDFGGITRDQVIGKPIWETYWLSISESAQNRVREAVKQAAKGEFIRYEMDVYGANHTVIPIDFSIRTIRNEAGQVVLLIPEGRDISDFKEIERSLRSSQRMLMEAQKIANLGNWEFNFFDNETIWSDQLFHIFGRDQALGSPNYEDAVKYYLEEDREALDLAVQSAISEGRSFQLELRLAKPRPDDSYCYIEAVGHAEYDENGSPVKLYGTVQDISDRKLIENQLNQNKALLRLTIENAPVGIATIGLDGKFLIVNQSFCKIYDYSAEELLNLTSSDITHPDSIEKTSAALSYLLENVNESIQIEKHYIHKDGHKIDAISRVSLMRDEQGNPLRFIASVEDVTERKQIETKLISAKLAESANKAKSEFLASMSHELRTPMNAVIGMTGILSNTPLSPDQKRYVSTIRQGGEMLLAVINDILDFSQIESGKLELEVRPFKLQQCVEDVLDLMTSRIADKSLDLSALINLKVPLEIIGDYSRLRQILLNLVSNAIKFTDKGEIALSITSRLIDPETNTHELLFNIRDTGIGIAPEAIARLFQSFSQADKSITRQYGGTGLGLVICKQLCELMGGKIDVKSVLGKGSTFSFSIQAKAIANPEINQNITNLTTKIDCFKGKSILVVSSNSTIRQAITLYNQAWSINTQVAFSAVKALQSLELSEFDAVIIDGSLVEIDVLDLAIDIQSVFPDLNLILLTFAETINRRNASVFEHYISKPITASKLYETLYKIFSGISTKTSISKDSRQSFQDLPQDLNLAINLPLEILVVEDNAVNQQILLLMLEQIGYIAEAVDNGSKGVEAIQIKPYDVVFMDMQMPIMDGLSATKNIRKLPVNQPWIIGLSADAFTESRDAALSIGMNEYLTKPFRLEDLLEVLQRVKKDAPTAIASEVLTEAITPQPVIESLNMQTLKSLEDAIGAENLSGLIDQYTQDSEMAISKMLAALSKNDLAAIRSENHKLKGASGSFGALELFKLCRSLESLCKICIESDQSNATDSQEIAIVIQKIENEYHQVSQALGKQKKP